MGYRNKQYVQQTFQQQIREMGVSMMKRVGKTHAQGIKGIQNTATSLHLHLTTLH